MVEQSGDRVAGQRREGAKIAAVVVAAAAAGCERDNGGKDPGSNLPADFSASGTWTGTVTRSGEELGVQFDLEETGIGTLGGRSYWQDPESSALVEAGALTGRREDANASWVSETKVAVEGTFEAQSFQGTMRFMRPSVGTELAGQLALVRR